MKKIIRLLTERKITVNQSIVFVLENRMKELEKLRDCDCITDELKEDYRQSVILLISQIDYLKTIWNIKK